MARAEWFYSSPAQLPSGWPASQRRPRWPQTQTKWAAHAAALVLPAAWARASPGPAGWQAAAARAGTWPVRQPGPPPPGAARSAWRDLATSPARGTTRRSPLRRLRAEWRHGGSLTADRGGGYDTERRVSQEPNGRAAPQWHHAAAVGHRSSSHAQRPTLISTYVAPVPAGRLPTRPCIYIYNRFLKARIRKPY